MEIRPGLTIACHVKILRTPDGFEPSLKALQAFTYPLGHGAYVCNILQAVTKRYTIG